MYVLGVGAGKYLYGQYGCACKMAASRLSAFMMDVMDQTSIHVLNRLVYFFSTNKLLAC